MAIKAEKLYIENINPHKNILNYIGQWGYDDLDEYANDKRAYLIKHSHWDIYEDVSLLNVEQVYDKLVNPTLFFHIAKKPFLWVGTDDEYNKEYVKKYNIEVHPMLYGGGNIINEVGDLSGAIVFPEWYNLTYKTIANKFLNYLKQKYPTIEMDTKTNDIIFNGKKVAAFGTRKMKQLCIIMFQINFSDKTELIKNICGLNENKMPGYIPDLTAEEVRKEVLSWLN